MPDTKEEDRRELSLAVSGMSCSACSARVQKKLNKLPGVDARVSIATETARVSVEPSGPSLDELIAAVQAAGYDAAELQGGQAASATGDEEGARRPWWRTDRGVRLLVSAALSLPVLVVSMVPPLQFPYWQWVVLALTTPVYLWGGWPFHRTALTNLRHGGVTMDTLVSLGTTAAYLWSLWALLFGSAGDAAMRMEFSLTASGAHDEIYFETAAVVVTVLLVGKLLEDRAKTSSRSTLHDLQERQAPRCTVLRDGAQAIVDTADVAVGERVLVRPGELVPLDGTVVEGASALEVSLLTGESHPAEVAEGDHAPAGAVNGNGRLIVEVTAAADESTLSQLGRLIADAQESRAPIQQLVDRVSLYFVPGILVISALTLLGHLIAGQGAEAAFTSAVAVLIVACPCALGLATPLAIMVATEQGAKLNLVIRGAQVLEAAAGVEEVLIDKTGTMTTGEMTIARVEPADGVGREELLALAAAVEAGSEHPIGRAIATAVPDAPEASAVEAIPGSGIAGTVHGARVTLTRPEAAVPDADRTGLTAVAITRAGEPLGSIYLSDEIREHSAEDVATLREMGVKPALLTGDNEAAARWAAEAVGIPPERVTAHATPQDKLRAVERLHDAGTRVAVAGDGLNDAAALARADLGIAMQSGAETAINAADITVLRNDVAGIIDALRLSRSTLRTIKGNLAWAFLYNVLLVPVAALGLLNPMLAGVAMALSSVFVVLNSLRLRGLKPHRA